MSYPYPQDRHLDRKEKGDQPYKDAKEAFTQNQAEVQAQASGEDDRFAGLSEEERNELQEREARERLRKIGEEVSSREDG